MVASTSASEHLAFFTLLKYAGKSLLACGLPTCVFSLLNQKTVWSGPAEILNLTCS